MYRIFVSFCCAFVAASATPLHDAILRDADLETLTTLAANPNVKNANGVPALHVAIGSDNYEASQLLIKLGADLNSVDASGACPIHYATCSNNLRMVNLLLENEANANCVDKKNRSALLMAAKYGYANIVKALMYNNPRKNIRVSIVDDQKWNAFHYAAHGNHDDIVDIVSLELVGLSSRNNSGNTPLNMAIIAGYNQVAFKLINIQANYLRKNGGEALRLAAKYGRKSVLLKLLKIGCDLEMKDREGRTVLMNAVDLPKNEAVDDHFLACNDRTEIVKALILSGANLEAVDNAGKNAAQLALECENYLSYHVIYKAMLADSNKRRFIQKFPVTPSGKSVVPELHWEITKRSPDLERIRTLLVPDKINATDYLDRSAVHLAVDANHVEIVKELISNNIDLTLKTPLGDTALHLAKNAEIAEILSRANPKLSDIANDLGLLPLHKAVKEKRDNVVEVLASAITDIRATERYVRHNNAVYWAAMGGRVRIVKCLLRNGAGKVIGTGEIMALHYAAGNRDEDMVYFLLKNGWSNTYPDEYGKIAVHQALHQSLLNSNNLDLIRRLMYGVKPDYVTLGGNSFLHWIALYASKPNVDAIKVLIEEFGVPLNLMTYRGKTALHISVKWNHTEVVGMLIDNGANVALKTPSGKTALHLACKYLRSESASMLMNTNRNVLSWKDFNDRTPIDLLLACSPDISLAKINTKMVMVALELTPEDIPPIKLKLALSHFSNSFANFVSGLTEPIAFQNYMNRAIEDLVKDSGIDASVAMDADSFDFKAVGIFYGMAAAYYPQLAYLDTSARNVEGKNQKMGEYEDPVKAFEASKYKPEYIKKLRCMLVESFMTEQGWKRFGGTYMSYIPQEIIEDTLLEVTNNGNVCGRIELVANSLMLTLKNRSELHQYVDVLRGQMIRLSEVIIPK